LVRHPALVRFGTKVNSEDHLAFFLRNQVFYNPRRIDPRSADCVMKSQLSEDGRQALAEVTVQHIGRDSVEALLPHITLPTLVLWGENDRVLSSRWAPYYHELLPRSRLVVFPKCGHQPMVEKTEETAEVIRDFLRGNGSQL
jgi:pimeloyl-ACP methyl ester carboxylesterase